MKILEYIDAIGEWSGLAARWLALALSAVVIFEVISRYLFNAPTIWAFDMAMMLTSMLFLLGAAYVMKQNAHIRVDVIYRMLPARLQHIIELIYYVFCFFPFTLVMVWYGSKAARYSWMAREISNTSQWGETVYWWKAVIPLAFFLLLLQGIAEFVRAIITFRNSFQERSQ